MSAAPQKTVRLRASGGKKPKAPAPVLIGQATEVKDALAAGPSPKKASSASQKASAARSKQPEKTETPEQQEQGGVSARRKSAPLPSTVPFFTLENTPYGRVTPEYVIEGLKEVVRKSLDAEDGKFNPAGANKALELLGRYIGVFGDRDGPTVEADQGPRVDVSGLSPKQLMELAKAVFAQGKK